MILIEIWIMIVIIIIQLIVIVSVILIIRSNIWLTIATNSVETNLKSLYVGKDIVKISQHISIEVSVQMQMSDIRHSSGEYGG